MRKLWPPTHDAFRIRAWALSIALSVNFGGVVWTLHGGLTDIIWWFGFPGALAFGLVTGQDLEGADFSWIGVAVWLVANLVFYYLVAWLFISAFQRAESWWPEKRS